MALTGKTRTYPTEDVTICLDAALSAERDRLTGERGPDAAKRIKELEERMRDSLITIRVTGVPYAEYLKIQHTHPARSGRYEPFNKETFYPDFVYKTGYEVEADGSLSKLSENPRKVWDEIASGFTVAELVALMQAVDRVNETRAETGFLSRGSALTEPSSPTFEPPERGE